MSADDHRRIGRCATHGDMARLYDDGSIGCHYLTVIESTSDHCMWAPLPAAVEVERLRAENQALRHLALSYMRRALEDTVVRRASKDTE